VQREFEEQVLPTADWSFRGLPFPRTRRSIPRDSAGKEQLNFYTSDEDVKVAVDYMVKAAQGGAAPAAEAAAPAPTPVQAPAAEAAAPAAPVADTSGKGKEVYDAVCFACHTPGAAGAPKFGDATAWAPRIGKGALYDHSINGFMGEAGMMPPKGGRPDFADADIKAAVDYMTAGSK